MDTETRVFLLELIGLMKRHNAVIKWHPNTEELCVMRVAGRLSEGLTLGSTEVWANDLEARLDQVTPRYSW